MDNVIYSGVVANGTECKKIDGFKMGDAKFYPGQIVMLKIQSMVNGPSIDIPGVIMDTQKELYDLTTSHNVGIIMLGKEDTYIHKYIYLPDVEPYLSDDQTIPSEAIKHFQKFGFNHINSEDMFYISNGPDEVGEVIVKINDVHFQSAE